MMSLPRHQCSKIRQMTPHDAAVRAMDELFGPIMGITLVLMSVFVPAAFLPGLTGQMYAQFALVIAATAGRSGTAPTTAGDCLRRLTANAGRCDGWPP